MCWLEGRVQVHQCTAHACASQLRGAFGVSSKDSSPAWLSTLAPPCGALCLLTCPAVCSWPGQPSNHCQPPPVMVPQLGDCGAHRAASRRRATAPARAATDAHQLHARLTPGSGRPDARRAQGVASARAAACAGVAVCPAVPRLSIPCPVAAVTSWSWRLLCACLVLGLSERCLAD